MDLMEDPLTSPNSVDVLVPDAAAARAMADRLDALPEVDRAMTLASFVPSHQQEKLGILADAKLVLLPVLSAGPSAGPNSDDEALAAMRNAAAKLERAGGEQPADNTLRRLASALNAAVSKGPEILPLLRQNLMTDFPRRLDDLRLAMQAQPVSLATLPPDMVREWVAPDGRQKVTVYPEGDGRSNDVLRQFVDAVRTVAPSPVGTPVSIQEAGDTVVHAFVMAGAVAFILITLLLRVALGRWLDVALVLAPLGLAALLTVITSVVGGLPINFANIITLPLLLGIGVAFDIYFVVNWRGGITHPLQSSTARAILFSALTTVCAFGSLALSSHPGTADMGILLTISLFYALLCTLFVLPAMLAAATPYRRH
jgi:hopanoid biosynthesis associated RND transporter like protein HpnN